MTSLPRYVALEERIQRVVVQHELFMGALCLEQATHSTPNIASVSNCMKFADWFSARDRLQFRHLPREAVCLTIF